MNAITDIAIVGAGPAGIAAAAAALEVGVRVTIIDGYAQIGGQYFKQLPPQFQLTHKLPHQQQAEKLFRSLQHPHLTLLTNTTVLGFSGDSRCLWLQGPRGFATLCARAVILATGAFDRPTAFPGWTLPGVMSLGAAQSLLKAQRVLPGKRVLLAGTGPLLLATAAALVWAGANVAGILEGSPVLQRLKPRHARALQGQIPRLREGWRYLETIRQARIPYFRGWGVCAAQGNATDGVTGVFVAPLDEQWRQLAHPSKLLSGDTLCIGYGFLPDTTLPRLAGAAHIFQPRIGGWVPARDPFMQTTLPGLYAAGDGAGIGGAPQAAVEGHIAGTSAAWRLRSTSGEGQLAHRLQPAFSALQGHRRFQLLLGDLFTPGPGIGDWANPETILCRCEIVTLETVDTAIAQGAESVTAVKGLTRCGMGDCQGRLCGTLIAARIARKTGKPVSDCGSIRPRTPLHPLPIGDLGAEIEGE